MCENGTEIAEDTQK